MSDPELLRRPPDREVLMARLVPPERAPVVTVRGRGQVYRTPDGDFPRVTSVLKVLGLGTEYLVRWAAGQERAAILEAVAEVYASGVELDGPAAFVGAVEARIGEAKQHQKLIAEAAEIGSSVHQAVGERLTCIIHNRPVPPVQLSDQALWAYMAWEDWFRQSNLTPLLVEQPVWNRELGYAGTIDWLAWHPERRLGIVDTKTSKYIYDEHHLQVTGYVKAARSLGLPVEWGLITRLPKNLTDPAFEIRELGKMGKRELTFTELEQAFEAALTAWRLLAGWSE